LRGPNLLFIKFDWYLLYLLFVGKTMNLDLIQKIRDVFEDQFVSTLDEIVQEVDIFTSSFFQSHSIPKVMADILASEVRCVEARLVALAAEEEERKREEARLVALAAEEEERKREEARLVALAAEEEERKREEARLAVFQTDDDQEALLKQRFDDTLRLAENFQSGNDYSNAANKFSEAIEIAERLPSAEKDIATLYNNRRFLIISIIYPLTSPPISFSSAMYERCNELDKSLSDIEVVLTMDPEHLEARIRRGRIHEAQVLL
jgi:hypothetical protein